MVARDGLHLRSGPRLEFGIVTTVPNGTVVTVDGFDGASNDWARVDLEGDGLVDGHMFAAFLRPTEVADPDEGVEEQTTQT